MSTVRPWPGNPDLATLYQPPAADAFTDSNRGPHDPRRT